MNKKDEYKMYKKFKPDYRNIFTAKAIALTAPAPVDRRHEATVAGYGKNYPGYLERKIEFAEWFN